jgi:hypothetical protein
VFGEYHRGVPADVVRAVQVQIQESTSFVLQLLSDRLTVACMNITASERLFKCFLSWVRYCRIRADMLASAPITMAVFVAAQQPLLLDVAVECLVECVRVYCNLNSDLAMIQILIPNIMGLEPLYDRLVVENEEDGAKGLCRVFAETAESFVNLIMGEAELNQVRCARGASTAPSHVDGAARCDRVCRSSL